MKKVPEHEYVLVRGPRTDAAGNPIAVNISFARAAEVDLTDYSFLRSCENYEEWVHTKELQIYSMVMGQK